MIVSPTPRATPAPASGAAVRKLSGTPARVPLLLRAVLPAVPLVGRLPGVRHTGADAPDLVLSRSGVRVDRTHLAAYARVCGFSVTDALPVTYPHVLGFGMQLMLMTDPAFPVEPLGLVHLDNTISQHRTVTADEVLDLSVHAAPVRPHAKGRLIDLISTASVAGDLVWESTTTLLARGSSGAPASGEASVRALSAPAGPVTWRLPADLGRRYARVSGDYNPIHLYGVTARAFGFRRPIAHGMWTKARCMATLQGRLPDAFSVEVAFKKPIPLPGSAHFGSDADSSGALRFGVRSGSGAEHLTGEVTPLA